MAKQHFRLAQTEGIVSQMATQLYAAYITAGKVQENTEDEWMTRAIREAIRISKTVDDEFQSEKEIS